MKPRIIRHLKLFLGYVIVRYLTQDTNNLNICKSIILLLFND